MDKSIVSTPLKIVLAEDDEDDQILFIEALSESTVPTQLKIVENGKELMNILISSDSNKFDIIILDINMPIKNGLECLKEIRANIKFEDTKCIILTTGNNEDLLEEAVKIGANLFLTKPFFIKDYTKLINDILAIS